MATQELLNLFKQFYTLWPERLPHRQQLGRHTYHRASELEYLRNEFLTGSQSAEHIFRAVQALSFNDGRALRIKLENGELWEITLTAKQIREGEN